ncbi:deoxyguanosinetriphosphate triphosphohydrolase family protein [Paenibacillus sp. FSL K6-2859]|uniref:deoxyguanosinetriphosphate triphosphohydrolase family protein n=1 Tax=Paenibacillus sp. FSL K6-2859 TaxID=2921482 RepID=UPI0030FA8D4A
MSIHELRRTRLIPDVVVAGSTTERPSDSRTEFSRDYARLIHSPAFRRLQGKSQVFGAGSGDYFRTRLTHSLEVAQIARHAASVLAEKYDLYEDKVSNPGFVIDPEVVECAALAHDIGHPPFGHKGEQVLNEALIGIAGDKPPLHFEGNAQNFRILMFLEKRKKEDGLNLSSAVLLGINKYPFEGSQKKLKGLYDSEWSHINELRRKWDIPNNKKTLEAQLMDLCDDIAYSTHDIEDGIKSKKIDFTNIRGADLYAEKVVKEFIVEYPEDHPIWDGRSIEDRVNEVIRRHIEKWTGILKDYNYDESRARRELKAEQVNYFVNNIGVIDQDNWKKVTFVHRNSNNENNEIIREVLILKKLAWVTMINDLRVQRLQKRSEKIIRGLWESFYNDKEGKIIPKDWMLKFEEGTDWSWERFILDYVSGMTDSFAEKIYGELFSINTRSIYDLD